MNDYYLEQSYGKLKIEGKAFDYVEVSKKRAEYADRQQPQRPADRGAGQAARPRRQGRAEGLRRHLLHLRRRADAASPAAACTGRTGRSVTHNGKRWPYFICPEGGAADGEHQRLLPRVRPHARPARPVRPAGEPRHRRASASGARWPTRPATAGRSTSPPGARSSSAGSSRPSSTRP